MTLEERWLAKTVTGSREECWWWLSPLNTHGYGQIRVGGRGSSPKGAHVVGYELYIGPVPPGKELHHTCENESCVNPWHQEPKTRLEHVMHHHYGRRAAA